MADSLDDAQARFAALSTYQATVQSMAPEGEGHVIRYFFRKPGWVRMDFVSPHGGTVLIYDPGLRRVRLWPFGVKHLPVLSLAPDNPLLRGAHGHRVDHSDVGTLLANLHDLRESGSITTLGKTQVNGHSATGLDITGHANAVVAGVHRYRVWLTHDTLFPLRVESFGLGGNTLERVEIVDPKIDIGFPEQLFTP